jgi:hypothetical protein
MVEDPNGFLNSEEVTARLTRNLSKQLLLLAALEPRRERFFSRLLNIGPIL